MTDALGVSILEEKHLTNRVIIASSAIGISGKRERMVQKMNDRYLYRAKRTDNGEWIVGSLIQTSYLGSIRSWISSEQEDKARLREISSNQAVWRAFEVRTDTICQCTGLKDWNGKLIWENDILLGYLDDSYPEDATYAEVLWWRSGFYTREKGSNDVHEIDAFTEQNYAVIGNIFDNLELLEVGE